MIVPATSSAAAGLATGEVDPVESIALEPHESPSGLPGAAASAAAAAPVSGDASGADAPRETSWLGDAVISGLVHCACSHNLVHPDVLSLVSDEIAAAARPGSEAAGDDAV